MPKPPTQSRAGEPRWQDHRRLPRGRIPAALRDWLLDPGSLTRHLVRRCPGPFRVLVRGQHRGRPLPGEARLLGLRPGAWTLVREVELQCAGRPWVFARTLIPPGTLRGAGRRLARLGDRPLGAVLFADPGVRRGRLELAALLPHHMLHRRAAVAGAPPLWARRTLFLLRGRPLLVNEVFLPEIPGP